MTNAPIPEMNVMIETPDEWLESLFEFEYCAECGGDAMDHEVCIVPGMGTYFARCKRRGEGCDATAHPENPERLTKPTVSAVT